MLKGTGIFITKEEREGLLTEYRCIGMFLSGGRPMGNPAQYAQMLTDKYHPPAGCGIKVATGEFMYEDNQ
jgi:hypothetical protein